MGTALTGCCVILRCLRLRVCAVAVGLALPVALCAAEPEVLGRVFESLPFHPLLPQH